MGENGAIPPQEAVLPADVPLLCASPSQLSRLSIPDPQEMEPTKAAPVIGKAKSRTPQKNKQTKPAQASRKARPATAIAALRESKMEVAGLKLTSQPEAKTAALEPELAPAPQPPATHVRHFEKDSQLLHEPE